MPKTLTTTAPSPATRPFMSFKRVGGLRHFRIGSFGGSFYVSKCAPQASRDRPAIDLLGMALCGALAAAGLMHALSGTARAADNEPTFALVATYEGSEYVLDSGLTFEDCDGFARRAIAKNETLEALPGKLYFKARRAAISCEVESGQ